MKMKTITQINECILVVLYTNIDLKLWNKSPGPMHFKIGVSCVYNEHVFYTML